MKAAGRTFALWVPHILFAVPSTFFKKAEVSIL
jgi:hypothetical protein